MDGLLINIVNIMPELFLSCSAIILLIIGSVWKSLSPSYIYYSSMACLMIALLLIVIFPCNDGYDLFEMLRISSFLTNIKIIVLIFAVLVLYLSVGSAQHDKIKIFEYPVLVIFAVVGMMLTISANDLMIIFLGLEMQSMVGYVLVAMQRKSLLSSEAGIKYFIFSVCSTIFFLFGTSYLYGFSGTTEFQGLYIAFNNTDTLPFYMLLAIALIAVSFAFKLSLAPCHFWMADIYQGSSTVVTMFLAVLPKISIATVFLSFFNTVLSKYNALWHSFVLYMALISIIVGSFAGLFQKNIKRLLAYSAVAHIGFAMLGVVDYQDFIGVEVFNYLVIYMIMNLGIFAVLLTMRVKERFIENIDDFAGIGKDAGVLGFCLTVMLFSMAGIPPLAGFFIKLKILKSLLQADHILVPLIIAVCGVLSAAYYLRIIKMMYFEQGDACVTFDHKAISNKFIAIVSSAIVMFYIICERWFIVMPSYYSE